MRLIAAILSDIHLTESPTHPFARRIDEVAAAIGSAEVNPGGILLILGGDLADKGEPAEYACMRTALDRLKEQLTARHPGVPIHLVGVPGNHDLLHPEDSEEYRRHLIEGSISTLRNAVPNSVYISQLLEPQKPYQQFAQFYEGQLADDLQRIVRSNTIRFGSVSVRLNLINTALVSQLHEQQGGIVLPIPLIRGVLEDGEAGSLSITLMHHALYWIESGTLMDLRELFGRSSDYVLTGHQHFSSGYQVADDLGPNIKYYESPAFYDPRRPTASAFRVLVFDLESGLERQLLFKWKDNIYSPDPALQTESSWSTLVQNRAIRPTIAMNAGALAKLNDPGFAYMSQQRSGVGLAELFVYPDFREASSGESAVKIIRGKDAFTHLVIPGVTVVQGAPLSGKTSLSKKLVLDIRSQNNAVPVWLDGADIVVGSQDDLQTVIEDAFKTQYSRQQLNAYVQLVRDQRVLVVDNWHLAQLPVAARPELYEWLKKFAGTVILLVDQVFQIKELISASPISPATEGSLPNGRRLVIGALNNVSKGALVQRWLNTRSNAEHIDHAEGRELQQIESLVNSLLGKDSLPPYPFYILCILQALESRKTAALAGGSFGPLFEIFILSALEKIQADDLQIALKLVFMQEIGFHMWSRGTTTISRAEVDQIAREYSDRYLSDFPVDKFLHDLKQVRILSSFDGNYSFMYPHYLYYSVARYIRNHFDDENAQGLREKVDELIDNLSSVQNSTIVMFLIYFEKDKHRIIDRLLRNASIIYAAVAPAKLEGESAFFSSIPSSIHAPQIDANPNIAHNRDQIRLQRDERELADSNRTPAQDATHSGQQAYGYHEGLPDSQKLHLAQQTISALGQVIRNFSANLEGPRKIAVLKETYLLGLRALARVMDAFREFIESLPKLQADPDSEISLASRKTLVAQGLIALTQLYAVVVVQNIANNIGVADMELAYNAVLQTLDMTVAIRLVDINIKMYHFSTFPDREIRELYRQIRSNKFAANCLQWLVASYLATNKVERRTLDGMAELFSLNKSALEEPEG